MTVTGVDGGAPGTTSWVQLGGVGLLSSSGAMTRSGKLTSTPDPHPCSNGGGGGSGSTNSTSDCGTKAVTQRFSLIPQPDSTMLWGSAYILGAPTKDPFTSCPSFVEHPFPAVLPMTIHYSPAALGPGMAPTLRGHGLNAFYSGQPQGSESASVELRLVPEIVQPAVFLGSRSTDERIGSDGRMTAVLGCPRKSACKGTLSVAYGSGAEPERPAAPGTVAAAAARTDKVRYPAPLKTGPLVSSLTLGSVKFALHRGQHKRIRLRLTKHSASFIKEYKSLPLGLIVGQRRGKAKLAYLVGTARIR